MYLIYVYKCIKLFAKFVQQIINKLLKYKHMLIEIYNL